jgi:protein SCO1/2
MSLAELILVFSTGLIGSIHCAAMCGGFSVGLVQPGHAQSSFARVAVYHAGKLFTYVFIGAAAGIAGAGVLNHPVVSNAQFGITALLGALVVGVGLQTLGLVPGPSIVNQVASRLWLGPFLGPFFQTFRQRDSLDGAFFLGLFNGFLPCGMVYTFALAAAGTGSFISAMIVMAAFGLGTIPMLATVAWGGARLAAHPALRPILTRISGVLVIGLGALTVLRGAPFFPALAAVDHLAHLGPAQSAISTIELEPIPAPAFTLTNQDGQTMSLDDLHGKVVVLDFIYTSCTTTCPLLTATLYSMQNALGPEFGTAVAFASITVDPETDTPAVLKAYGAKWEANSDGWAFLTGSPAEIESVAARYGIAVERTGADVTHTESIMLIDRHGQLRAAYNLRTDPEVILQRVEELLQ